MPSSKDSTSSSEGIGGAGLGAKAMSAVAMINFLTQKLITVASPSSLPLSNDEDPDGESPEAVCVHPCGSCIKPQLL
jgi:hypothetical protein